MALNEMIQSKISEEYPNYIYIDLDLEFVDEIYQLIEEYPYGGVHLTAEGYSKQLEVVCKYVYELVWL